MLIICYTKAKQKPRSGTLHRQGLSSFRRYATRGCASDCCLLEEFLADVICCETCYETDAECYEDAYHPFHLPSPAGLPTRGQQCWNYSTAILKTKGG